MKIIHKEKEFQIKKREQCPGELRQYIKKFKIYVVFVLEREHKRGKAEKSYTRK
jgi:hypothetical protein